MKPNYLNEIYQKLLEEYGPQGWWPYTDIKTKDTIKKGSTEGYHPGIYIYPKNESQKTQIIIGAILTQNTNWQGAYNAIKNINQKLDFNPQLILDYAKKEPDEFKKLIKPAGYYNQKYNYIINILEYIKDLNNIPNRKDLLNIKGIGNETADTILLFAFKKKEFIVDTYLKRIFIYLNFITENDNYNKIKTKFEHNFQGNVEDYQEFHALLDEHAKHYYTKKPYGVLDKLLNNYKLKE